MSEEPPQPAPVYTGAPYVEDQETMIAAMHRFARLKAALEEEEARAKKYLEQVKAGITQDLAPLRGEMEGLRNSMRIFVTEHHGGAPFRVPGLGTAYVQSRRQVRIVDEKAFTGALDAAGKSEVYESRFAYAKARKIAERRLSEDGEILPGVEAEEVETISLRITASKDIS